MGLFDWFRRRKNHLRKLRTEIEEHVEEEPKRAKRKRKKESV